MPHPLSDFRIQASNIKCFDETGSGFIGFLPISVIIGKNNSGKSSVVDLIDIAIKRSNADWLRPSQRRGNEQASFDIESTLKEGPLKRNFQDGTYGGEISGNHWVFGKRFLTVPSRWRYTESTTPKYLGTIFDEVLKTIFLNG